MEVWDGVSGKGTNRRPGRRIEDGCGNHMKRMQGSMRNLQLSLSVTTPSAKQDRQG